MYTEIQIMKIAGHLLSLKDPKAERLLIWGLGQTPKVNLFGSLERWITDTNDKTELLEIYKKAEDLCEKRNSLVHGIWGYRPGKHKE